MKINWTEEIPTTPGLYLVKVSNIMKIMYISKGDLKIQKDDVNWLSGFDYWSIEPIEEENE